MRSQTLIFGLAAAGCTFANPNEAKETATSTTDHVAPWIPMHTPKWVATAVPEKVSSLKADMHSLASSVHKNKLYTSMTAVMATAIPETFKEAMMTNPKSMHKQYKTTTPEWYKAIPSDVRHFMEENKKAAKSIFSKDIGPMPTHTKDKEGAHGTQSAHATQSAQETGKNKEGKVQKSEADSLRMAGATMAALLGTLGFALLML